MTVKVRRVGNSNVVTIPRGLERYGFTEGQDVSFVPLETGEVLLVAAAQMETYMQQLGGQILARRGRAMATLAAHDGGGADESV